MHWGTRKVIVTFAVIRQVLLFLIVRQILLCSTQFCLFFFFFLWWIIKTIVQPLANNPRLMMFQLTQRKHISNFSEAKVEKKIHNSHKLTFVELTVERNIPHFSRQNCFNLLGQWLKWINIITFIIIVFLFIPFFRVTLFWVLSCWFFGIFFPFFSSLDSGK